MGKLKKELDVERKRSESAKGRDIGEIPEIQNKKRRLSCKRNLHKFLKTYLRKSFPLPFGSCHRRAIKKLETSMLKGGLFALAMPRGYGKTSITEGANIWAALYGHRKYILCVAANAEKAKNLLESIRREIEGNEEIAADFPEISYPVEKLEGIALRANGQLCRGESTGIRWGSKIVFPTCQESQKAGNAGVIIESVGISGSIRGRRFKLRDGTNARPDFVQLDDPQDRVDAESQGETDKHERIVCADVLGLAGHGKKIAAACLCTVVKRGDLADRLLDKTKHPEWRGQRTAMIEAWPKAEALWAEYLKIRKAGLNDGDGGAAAAKFYRKNRREMDKGASTSWPSVRSGDELSAIQHAYNLLCDMGEEAFFSEYQNQPRESRQSAYELTPEMVCSRISGRSKLAVPDKSEFLVAMCDINLSGMRWAVVGVEGDMSTHVVDYGKHPEGSKYLWSQDYKDGRTEAQAIHAGILAVSELLTGREYRGSAARKHFDLILFDCGYMTETVFKACEFVRDKHRTNIYPSRGQASKTYKQHRAIGRPGDNVHLTEWAGKGRVVCHNSDFHREQAQKMFLLPPGSSGAIDLYQPSHPKEHSEFARHVCSEKLVEKIRGDAADYYNWRKQPGDANDWLDALVGAAAGANLLGASYSGGERSWRAAPQPQESTANRPTISFQPI